jgi:hypothetical protein
MGRYMPVCLTGTPFFSYPKPGESNSNHKAPFLYYPRFISDQCSHPNRFSNQNIWRIFKIRNAASSDLFIFTINIWHTQERPMWKGCCSLQAHVWWRLCHVQRSRSWVVETCEINLSVCVCVRARAFAHVCFLGYRTICCPLGVKAWGKFCVVAVA